MFRSDSSLPLKPAAAPQNRHTLIHDPLPHPQVILHPPLDLLAFGEFVRLQAGARETIGLWLAEWFCDEDMARGGKR